MSPVFLCFLGLFLLVKQSMDYPTDTLGLYSKSYGDNDNPQDPEGALGDWDQTRFTPSMLDTNSFAFSNFVNQHSGEFSTPTPGPSNNFFHTQAGDLHTPGMAFQLGTPLSSDDSHPVSAVDLHGFHPHLLDTQPFQDHANFQPPQAFAPSSFVHQDSGYDTVDAANLDAPLQKLDEHQQHEVADFGTKPYEGALVSQMPSLEKYGNPRLPSSPSTPLTAIRDRFRYHVTLNAPTAMIKQVDEIPVTYLNKGQAYAVTINDSVPTHQSTGPVKYRTVVRISFEDEQQRQRPSACWQLWKEGRGLAEAHQRGGKLQAVEFVDPNQGGDAETRKPRVELETASFDCFSVIWSPTPGASTASCSVSVRFNFLSTDFSHSKGVKGIPVRLCTKTEIISSGTPDSPPGPTAEVCFCKVKLFRDHGAERKLSNDIAHIKKTIDKLKQQIAQVENGVKDVGKRKRSGSASKATSHRTGKVLKHKRTWSVSSQGSGGRPAAEDDLHMKLATMQDMFSSTRPVSVLYLKGYEQDDPDAFPVSLPGEPTDLTKPSPTDRRTSWDQKLSGDSTPTNSTVSPTPSSRSNPSHSHTRGSAFQQPTPVTLPSTEPSESWQHLTNPTFASGSEPTIKVQKTGDNSVPDWIDAFGVDPSYQAPPERPIKPIACFYVLIKISGQHSEDDCYRAVYLMERSVRDLINSIAKKCGVEPAQVTRTVRINPKGLKIMVDDEVVRELPEGQDMIVEFSEVEAVKAEPGSGASTPKASAVTPNRIAPPQMLEMRLLF